MTNLTNLVWVRAQATETTVSRTGCDDAREPFSQRCWWRTGLAAPGACHVPSSPHRHAQRVVALCAQVREAEHRRDGVCTGLVQHNDQCRCTSRTQLHAHSSVVASVHSLLASGIVRSCTCRYTKHDTRQKIQDTRPTRHKMAGAVHRIDGPEGNRVSATGRGRSYMLISL